MEFFIAIDGQRAGPFTTEQLRDREIGPDTPVWTKGLTAWTSAAAVPELRELLQTLPPPLPEMPPPLPEPTPALQRHPAPRRRPKAAWNPAVVAWLGLLFTPLWSAILAAVNARRLGLARAWWKPLLVPAAYVAEEIVRDGIPLLDAYWIDISMHALSAWGVWRVELCHQAGTYADRTPAKASWIVPLLAGSPLGLLTLIAFAVMPLVPLQPRQVCENFNRATTIAEASRYSTANLQPALEAVLKMESGGDSGAVELTEEAVAPAEMGGGYLVGVRYVFAEKGVKNTLEGFYRLVNWDGTWKVEEMYLTIANGRNLERPIQVSRDYPALLANATPSANNTGQRTAAAKPTADSFWSLFDSAKAERIVGRGILLQFIKKNPKIGAGVVLAVVLLPVTGLIFLFRCLKFVLRSPKQPPGA